MRSEGIRSVITRRVTRRKTRWYIFGTGAASFFVLALSTSPVCLARSRPMLLETERLSIRGWTLEDVGPHRLMASDVGYTCFSTPGFFSFKDEQELREKVARRAILFSETGFGKYLVFEKGTQAFVGTCGIEPFDNNGAPGYELGYRLMLDQWGKGYATEAANTVMNYFFEGLGRPLLHAFALAQNAVSLKIIGKLGFKRCGEVKYNGLVNQLYVRESRC